MGLFNHTFPAAAVETVTHVSILENVLPCQPEHPLLRKHAIEDAICNVYPGSAEFGGRCLHAAIPQPMYDKDGNHVDTLIVLLAEDGQTRQMCLNRLEHKGAFARIGTPSGGSIFIAEDWASGQSLYLATGNRVAVAVESDNLAEVCEVLRQKYPDTRRVLCLGNTYSAKQREQLCTTADLTDTQVILLDDLGQSPATHLTFNDLHCHSGLDAVARRLSVATGNDNEPAPASALSMAPHLWPHPVCGKRLLKKLLKVIRRHTILSREAAMATALWIIFTYTISKARIAPILLIHSPVKRCGKTTLGSLLGYLVSRPLSTANITAAALFRLIDAEAPTLLIDEADTFIFGSDDLTGMINSGHTRNNAYSVRCAGAGHKRFRTWCAKTLMMIGLPPETIKDRSIAISLIRKRPDQKVVHLGETKTRELEILQQQIARWADDNLQRIAQLAVEPPELGNDRAADNWEPLLAIAKSIGDECYEAAIDAAYVLSSAHEDQLSFDEQLLQDIHAVFIAAKADRISSVDLIQALCADPDKPWASMDRGRPISSRDLAVRLAKFGIKKGNVRVRDGVIKGYKREEFEDAFARYVPTPLR